MKHVILIIMISVNMQTYAQQILGRVINNKGEVIELVNVVLYDTRDSTLITGTITNQDGEFIIENMNKKDLYIKLTCLGYKDTIYTALLDSKADYILDESIQILNEVKITASRPIVKIDDGKLSFDVPTLIQQRPINSAFDILGEIPGVEKNGDRISIIGANSTTIIINNRVSSMSFEQIVEYLKSVPPEHIKRVELLYVTPPKYGVNGSSINILIDNYRTTKRERKAQIVLEGNQAHCFSPSTGFSYSSANEKSLLNVVYLFRYDNANPSEKLDAFHLLNNESHHISLENNSKTKYKTHNIGLSFDYDLKNKDVISFSYNANINRSDTKRNGLIVVDEDQYIKSVNKRKGPSDLHSVSINYSHNNLLIGADYSYYNNKKDQYLINSREQTSDSIISNSKQIVNQASFYMSNEHVLMKNLKLSYGINTKMNHSDNDQSTFINNKPDNVFSQEQSEYSVDGFVGWSQNFGKKFTVNANMLLEYYEANIASGDINQTIWQDWNLYPTITMVYRIAPMKILQFSVLSERRYPSYWQTTPNITYMNYYVAIEGNPNIKPSKIYSGRLNFILRGKYIFQLFGNVSSDYIQQSLYQSSDKLQATYKVINLDKHNTFGSMAVLPFKIGQVIDSKLTLSGFLISDKGVLEDVFFDRKKMFGRISMNNNFYLNTKKNLSIQLNGFYATKSIQGIYDIKPMYNLSTGIVWTVNERLKLSMVGDDLLNGRRGRTLTNIQNQNYNQIINNDSRRFLVSIRYNIGGYKEKKSSNIDTSRFGL